MKTIETQAREDQNSNEERLRLAAEIARLGIWEMDLKTNTFIRNTMDATLFGLAPTGYGATLDDFIEMVYRDDEQAVRSAFGEMAKGDRPAGCEYRVKAENGVIHWFYIEGQAITNGEEKPTRVVGVTREITSKKEMQLELRSSEYNLRRAQEIAHLGSYVIDVVSPENDHWSEETYRIYGISPLSGPIPHNDLLSRIVHPLDRERAADAFVRAVDEDMMLNVELRIVRPDQSIRYVHLLAEPICNRNGRVVQLQGTVQDITARHRAEEEIRNSQEKTKSILNTTADAIITIGGNGCIQSFNQAAEALFGYKLDEVIGQNVSILMPLPDRIRHDQYITNYLNTGEAKIIGIGREVKGQRKDGSVFPMELAVSEVKLGAQRIFTGIIRDITRRRELEQQIIQISEYERQRIGQELHDALGSQLTGIGLICNHLVRQMKAEDEALSEELAEVARQVKEADYLARNIARGLVPVAPEPGGLLQALRRLADTANKVYGVSCEFKGDEAALVKNYVKSTHLYRIAQEALNNAVKHGKAGQVRIHLAAVEPNAVELAISDDGIGFPEHLPEERGIGVRTMHYRANLIGGSLKIARRPDAGTGVTCYLPNIDNDEVTE